MENLNTINTPTQDINIQYISVVYKYTQNVDHISFGISHYPKQAFGSQNHDIQHHSSQNHRPI